jgi:hypothetical protein
MILIDEIIVDNVNIKFYEGMDFDLLLNHNRDGSDGFIFCFIESWVNEVKSYNRQRKVVSLVDNTNYEEFEWEEINNNYISVYQTEGMDIHSVYEAIRSKVERKQLEQRPWEPVRGIMTGAWNLSKRLEITKNHN